MASVDLSRIGERIQRARKLKKLSVAEVAQQVHFTSKSIVYAENGQADLSLEFLLALCNVLDVTPNDLLEGQFHCTRTQSLREEAELAELRALVESLKEEAGIDDVNSTRIKDTESAIEEIRQAVYDYKLAESLAESMPKKKKSTHW